MKNQNPILNPYQIKWGIFNIEHGSLSLSRKHALAKAAETSVSSTHGFFHGCGKAFEKRVQRVLDNLSTSGVHGKLYIITDKQYGMIQNSWNGTEPSQAKPFTRKVTIHEGKLLSVIPVSRLQAETAYIF